MKLTKLLKNTIEFYKRNEINAIEPTEYDNDQAKLLAETLHTLTPRSKYYSYLKPSPISNTGLKLERALTWADQIGLKDSYDLKKYYQDYPTPHTQLIMTDDGVKPIIIKRPKKNEICHVDTVSFTIGIETFNTIRTNELQQDDYENEVIAQLDKELKKITGFSIDYELKNGLNYYQRSYKMENDIGIVSIGGQNDTILVQLSGECANYARRGWELDLVAFLDLIASRPKISRLDIAYDDLDGNHISVDWALEQYMHNGFNNGGRNPTVEQRGNWIKPDGKGRTLYVGSRQSGKFVRVYEKGKQLGDKDSSWTRFEIEFKAKHLFIPTEALLKPSEYFLASYPCLLGLDLDCRHIEPKKFERRERSVQITFEKAVDITRHQFGRYLFAFRDFYEDEELLDLLMPTRNKSYPERLDLLTIPDHFQNNPHEVIA